MIGLRGIWWYYPWHAMFLLIHFLGYTWMLSSYFSLFFFFYLPILFHSRLPLRVLLIMRFARSILVCIFSLRLEGHCRDQLSAWLFHTFSLIFLGSSCIIIYLACSLFCKFSARIKVLHACRPMIREHINPTYSAWERARRKKDEDEQGAHYPPRERACV